MRTFTYHRIMELDPCYDPAERGYCSRDWEGTTLDVLRHPNIPAGDKLWLVLREGWVPNRELRLFVVGCARRALEQVGNPDPRSVTVCDVAERHANGKASEKELAAALAAARDAAFDGEGVAAWVAYWGADRVAAWGAYRVAAWVAAGDAVWDAERDAERGAYWGAVWVAAWGAERDAAWDAAWDEAFVAEQEAQVARLIKMLKDEEDD